MMKGLKKVLTLLLAGLLVLTVGFHYDNRKVELSPPVAVEAADGKIIFDGPAREASVAHVLVVRDSTAPPADG